MGGSHEESVSPASDAQLLSEQIIAQIPVPIAVRDRQGRYLFANQAYAHRRGQSSENILRSLSKTLAADREVIDSGRPSVVIEAKELDRVWQTTKTALTMPDGMRAVLEIAVDVTELREGGDPRTPHKDNITKAQHAMSLGSIAAGVAHDFNNILVGVLGNIGLMQDIPEVVRLANQPMARIESAAMRCAKLSRQILAYSGHSQVQSIDFDLSALILSMQEILKRAAGIGHELQLELGKGVFLHANPTSVQQIVLNLVANAGQSYAEGRGTITLTTQVLATAEPANTQHDFERELPNETYVCIEAKDEGSGMSPSTLSKAFTAYFSTHDKQAGLGLSAVASLAHDLGGAVRAQSEMGRGTRLRVLLPKLVSPSPS